MGRIPRVFIDELLARVDIVDVINARVPLKKTGRNFVALCPFHDEKTPSFSVSPSKQFYHCFGCGASGSAIGFLMEYDHLTFPEAVEALAAQYGLKVPREMGDRQQADEAKRQRLQALYQLNQAVAVFYARQLQDSGGQPALNYLRRRGVDEETARRYGLGYAPPGWETLSRHFDAELLEEAGLVIAREGGRRRDLFRHRLMFPIRNPRGQVIGFGGRALESRGPKYLNSPETEIFNKGREVYGLYELLQAGGRPARIVVVEGYLDVIALAQHGIPQAVAVLGTAVTSEHTRLLFQYTEELTFCFDGDSAGRKAAWRALEAVSPQLQSGRKASFLQLPQGEDPDSLVRSQGAQAFMRCLQEAEPLQDYLSRALREGLDLSRAAKLVRPLLQRPPQGAFRRRIEDKPVELAGSRGVENHAGQTDLATLCLEDQIVRLLIQHPREFKRLPPEYREMGRDIKHELLQQVVSVLSEIDEPTPASWLDKFQHSPYLSRLQELMDLKELQSIPDPGKELRDAVAKLQKKIRKDRLKAMAQRADTEGLSEEDRAKLRGLMAANGESSLVEDI